MKIIGVITTKNRPQLFSKALSSALSQSRKLDQLIVVSDSTTDNLAIEKQIAGERAVFLTDIYTNNYAGSLNTALHFVIEQNLFSAHSYDDTYIAFLDDDDVWNKNYLEKCESVVTKGEDFVITGLNYYDEYKCQKLSIPQTVSIGDFLEGNPHIQGSNTFVKFSTLLKAGLFDENMSSTTDRDIFTRIMMLKPTWVVVNEHLVDVDARNDRIRITNNTEKKCDGLRKFYYKYNGWMSEDIKKAFFLRAESAFNIQKMDILNIPQNNKYFKNEDRSVSGYKGNLVIGIIATEYELTLRLLRELCELHRENTKVVVLINFEKSTDEYVNILADSGYRYELLTRPRIIEQLEKRDDQFVSLKQVQQSVIKDIAVSRSILQHYLYEFSRDGDVIWVLDDDMQIKQIVLLESGLVTKKVNIDSIIPMYQNKYDAVIGNYSLDAPVPTLSTLRTSLLDYTFNKLGNIGNACTLETYDDYYYDLSDINRTHLETPLHIKRQASLDLIFSGKAVARPLFLHDQRIKKVVSRGGNTIIFNRELLKIPNWSLQVSDKLGRRSDYFWVLQTEKQNYKLANVPFAMYHNRSISTFDYQKEKNKLLLDFIGSSFTKAVEKIGIEANKNKFYDSYKFNYISRLTKYIASYYRIIGLLSIIKEPKYSGIFTENSLNSFVKEGETYLQYESVLAAYESLCRKIHMQAQMQNKKDMEEEIRLYFGVKIPLRFLGNGGEGAVFTDGETVYKLFFKKPKNWDFLHSVYAGFPECEQLSKLELVAIDGRYIIKYNFEKYVDYSGGHAEEMASLIRFFKEKGIVFTNFKKENFVIANGKLKLIDYGKSIEPFTKEKYDYSVHRAYELLRYPFLNEEEFKQLIQLFYHGKTKAIDSGIENFEKLISVRYKETLHDGNVCELINKYNPRHILDYGAGKCKIANSLSGKYNFSVFDIDTNTLKTRADENVEVFENFEEIPDDSYEMIINSLVLCCVDKDTACDIVSKIASKLSINGKAIISICNPFYNNIAHTELRTQGLNYSYFNAASFDKHNKVGSPIRKEFHRPIEFYINLLQRNGLEIENIIECDGVNTDTLLSIGEHLILDCKLVSKPGKIDDCSLLIKTNPMESNRIYDCIKHIVNSLEKNVQFKKRLIVADISQCADRTRKYAEDDIRILKAELQRALNNGLIDKIYYAPQDESFIRNIYRQYFYLENVNPHSSNGQGLFATLYAFDQIKTLYVFQTDSDILYYNSSKDDFMKAFNAVKNGAITVSLSIPHQFESTTVFGRRTEVRSCFLNINELKIRLPLLNEIQDGVLKLTWHRSLDAMLLTNESARIVSNKT